MSATQGSPLTGLGAAARWCLVSGVVAGAGPPPPGSDFEDDSDEIIGEGLASVAVRALAGHTEYRDLPCFGVFRGVALGAELHSMSVDAAGVRLLGGLAGRGMGAAVVKGPAVARLHPAGWPRPYADVDVLVDRSHFDDAVAVALSQGFVYADRSVPQWPWFDRVCREGINLHSPDGGNVDLHHHVSPWALGSHLPATAVVNRSLAVEFCGMRIRVASDEDLLVVSALHVVNDLWKGKRGLVSWRDVLVIVHRIGRDRSAAAFQRVRLGWLFEVMVDELARELPEAGIAGPVRPTALSWVERFRLASSGWANDSLPTRHRIAWAARLPPANAVAFIAGSAVPSRSYVRDHDGSYRNYWRRAARETVSTAHGSDLRMTSAHELD